MGDVQIPSLRGFLGAIALTKATAPTTRRRLSSLVGGLTQNDLDVRDAVNTLVTALDTLAGGGGRLRISIVDSASPTVVATTDAGPNSFLDIVDPNSGPLTASRTMQLPVVEGARWDVRNRSSKPIATQHAGGASVVLRPGSRKILSSDGTNVSNAVLGAWFDVTDFGAFGDGATDDTAAIQAALNAARASGASAVVYLPPGTYVVASTLTYHQTWVSGSFLVPGVTILGAGMDATWIDNRVASGSCISVRSLTASKFVVGGGVRELSIMTTTSPSSSNGIELLGVCHHTIEHVHITGLSGDGIRYSIVLGDPDGPFACAVKNVRVEGCANGINCNFASGKTQFSSFLLERSFFFTCSVGVRYIGFQGTIADCAFSQCTRGLYLPFNAANTILLTHTGTSYENCGDQTAATMSAGGHATTTSGSHTLPTGTITVAATTGFAAAGAFLVGGQTVRYTSVDATHFLGCTGGTGTIADGSAVTDIVGAHASVTIESLIGGCFLCTEIAQTTPSPLAQIGLWLNAPSGAAILNVDARVTMLRIDPSNIPYTAWRLDAVVSGAVDQIHLSNFSVVSWSDTTQSRYAIASTCTRVQANDTYFQGTAANAGSIACTNGANVDVALPIDNDSFVLAGPTGAFSISGLTNGAPGGMGGSGEGRTISLLNTTGQVLTIVAGTGSAAANQIITDAGANLTINNNGFVTLRYFAAKWRVVGHG